MFKFNKDGKNESNNENKQSNSILNDQSNTSF